MNDEIPVYNLKAVIAETGLSPATLRAWERRYELVKPMRSPGGHRLYSRQDIEHLKWLVARQKEGLSISQAVALWKTRPAGVQREPSHTKTSVLITERSEWSFDQLRDHWITACLEFDDQQANQVLDQAYALASPEIISMEILQKGLARIGQAWYAGKVSVQQEHFAAALAKRRLNTLLSGIPGPARPETILAACPPGEEHDFMLLMVSYVLRRSGWNVIFLGSNVPLERLDATIKATQPSLVLSAAQTLFGAASLSRLSQYLVSQSIHLAYGGGIFSQVPAAIRHISGYYLGTNITLLPGIIELLVVAPPDLPQVPLVTPEYMRLLTTFNRHESAMLAQVASALPNGILDPAELEFANTYLSRLIAAALSLGDIQLLDPAIPWLDGWLQNHSSSDSTTRQFYNAYRQVAEDILGREGLFITDWLQTIESAHIHQG